MDETMTFKITHEISFSPEVVALLRELFGDGFSPAVTGDLFFKNIGEQMAKSVMRTDSDGSKGTIVYKDLKGKPGAKVYSVPAWSLSTDAVVDMVVADDGMSATFMPKDVGVVTVNVQAEGAATAGEQVIQNTGDIEVIPSDAETGEISFEPVVP